jgi:NADH-quinone oxidoreductase subunit F
MIGPTQLESIFKFHPCATHRQPGRLMMELALPEVSAQESVLCSVIRRQGRDAALELLDQSGVRGRAGGGFPTGHKWWLVASSLEPRKFFVCNANLSDPGQGKESWFILTNAQKVIEAVSVGAYCADAHHAYIAIPQHAHAEIAALEKSIYSARQSGLLGRNILGSGFDLELELVKTPGTHIAGEETALLEFIEGNALQPRKRPPLPTAAGLFGMPTVVNNLETILQCRFALKFGADKYRELGAPQATGTMVFTLHGNVRRPGLYELPLGSSMRELIFNCGGGLVSPGDLKAIFPGGIGSPVLGASALDVPLDFDSLRDAGSDLGSGLVIVVGQDTCAVELATRLSEFFRDASCGKCSPCKDGTARTHTMLTKIKHLEQPSVDLADRTLPESRRQPQPQLTILNNVAHGMSYTDQVKGLDKISYLCEFFKYRGDCHHSTAAAGSILSLIAGFPLEFEQHMRDGVCGLKAEVRPGTSALTAAV